MNTLIFILRIMASLAMPAPVIIAGDLTADHGQCEAFALTNGDAPVLICDQGKRLVISAD